MGVDGLWFSCFICSGGRKRRLAGLGGGNMRVKLYREAVGGTRIANPEDRRSVNFHGTGEEESCHCGNQVGPPIIIAYFIKRTLELWQICTIIDSASVDCRRYRDFYVR